MDRVFLDANVLFSAAWAPTALMRRLWVLAPTRVVLITSAQAIEEARRNLPPSKHDDLDALLQNLEQVGTPPPQEWRELTEIRLPGKDLPLFQAAISASATHFLTGDRRHFGPYYGQTIEGVLILPPAAYPPAASDANGRETTADTV